MAKRKKDEFDRIIVSEDILRENRNTIKDLESMLKADQKRKEPKISDEALFRDEIDKHQKIIDEHSPRKLTGAKANKAYDEAKKLEKEVGEALLPNRAFSQSYPKSRASHSKERSFDEAVRQQMVLQTDPELKRKMNRIKNIYRQLDPNDPTVANLERLRG